MNGRRKEYANETEMLFDLERQIEDLRSEVSEQRELVTVLNGALMGQYENMYREFSALGATLAKKEATIQDDNSGGSGIAPQGTIRA